MVVHEGKILCGTDGGNILVCRLAVHEEGAIEVRKKKEKKKRERGKGGKGEDFSHFFCLFLGD